MVIAGEIFIILILLAAFAAVYEKLEEMDASIQLTRRACIKALRKQVDEYEFPGEADGDTE